MSTKTKKERKVVMIRDGNCLESMPCIHSNVTLVYSDGTKEILGSMTGLELANLYVKHGLTVDEHVFRYIDPAKMKAGQRVRPNPSLI